MELVEANTLEYIGGLVSGCPHSLPETYANSGYPRLGQRSRICTSLRPSALRSRLSQPARCMRGGRRATDSFGVPPMKAFGGSYVLHFI